MENKQVVSALWEQVAPLVAETQGDLSQFRLPGGPNSRLAHWEPREPTLRWFKSYLQLAIATTPIDQCELLARLGRIDLGGPITVSASSAKTEGVCASNLDYLYAAEEFAFLADSIDMCAVTTVCELGAGFGRTAHLLLETQKGIKFYFIVDIPETLELSRAYLSSVLGPDDFAKVRFVKAGALERYPTCVDLFIQIDGFQEMDQEVIDEYYQSLVLGSRSVYCCNPVGKYAPETAGVVGLNPAGYEAAKTLGRTRGIVDPWDEASLQAARPQHLDNYCPVGYQPIATVPSRLRPYYLHALYQPATDI